MTDKPSTPVSVRKSPGTPGAPDPATPRPTTVKALVVLLLLAGVSAVIAAATLFGLHDYLVKSLRDNNPVPPLTSTQIQQQGAGLQQFLKSDLTQNPGLADTQVAARATDAQNYVQHHLPKSNVSATDITDQASKVHDDVSTSLTAAPGATLTPTQIQTQAQQLSSSYVSNLKDLQQSQPVPLTNAEILDKANKTPGALLLSNGLLLLALVFVALSVWRGKYWSRWAVIGLWFVLSFTSAAFGGLGSALYALTSLPVPFKIPLAASGVFYIAAVVFTFLRPSADYFNANRPVRPGGAAPARRGLFAPRVPPAPRGGAAGSAAKSPAQTRPAQPGASSSDRSKAKQRASADAVAKGAELARSRAKASKSRRTGV